MSNYLAIATVTATIRQAMEEALRQKLPGADVTLKRPDQLPPPHGNAGLNIYLFQVAPNASLWNRDLPVRAQDGRSINRPRVALDLRYLFTCLGKEEQLEPERVLGITAIAMQSFPVLGWNEIAQTVGSLPGDLLAGSDLASQSERVKFHLSTFSVEELHRLWAIFSPVPYRLSLIYEASVVLLDAEVAPPRALPVSQPRLQGPPDPMPRLDRVIPPRLVFAPGATIQLQGQNLSPDVVALMNGVEAAAVAASPTELTLSVPSRAPAGPLAVSVAVRRTTPDQPPRFFQASGSLPFLLLPSLAAPPGFRLRADPRSGVEMQTIIVTPQPDIAPRQRARIFLNEKPQPGDPARNFSSDALLSFAIRETTPIPSNGDVPDLLQREFSSNGIPLSADSRVDRPEGSDILRVIDARAGQAYHIRTDHTPWTVYFGLEPADPPGVIAFRVVNVPPGKYLVRYAVDEVESQLEVDRSTGEFAGPSVSIT